MRNPFLHLLTVLLACFFLTSCGQDEKASSTSVNTNRDFHEDDDTYRQDQATYDAYTEDTSAYGRAVDAVVDSILAETERIQRQVKTDEAEDGLSADDDSYSRRERDEVDGPESGLYGFDPWDDEDDEWNMDREMTDPYPDEW